MATSSAVDAYSLFTFGLIPRSLPHTGTTRPFTFKTKHSPLQPACACWGVHTEAHMYNTLLLQILHYSKPFTRPTESHGLHAWTTSTKPLSTTTKYQLPQTHTTTKYHKPRHTTSAALPILDCSTHPTTDQQPNLNTL